MKAKILFTILTLLHCPFVLPAQAIRPILATSQVGFRSDSPKMLTLIPAAGQALPDSIPFYLHRAGANLPRVVEKSAIWAGAPYSYPYDLQEGRLAGLTSAMYNYRGWLVKKESRWGAVWQADFSDFATEGLYQIETELQSTVPFAIEPNPYARFLRGYMEYIHSQRSGFDLPGIRSAQHLDDGRLDDGSGYLLAAGGWYNAGDLRKWMSLTQFNLEALYHIHRYGPEAFRPAVIDEIQWGNRYFHSMITAEGRVYEDIGGGNLRAGFEYADGWWAENHPGCIANNAGNIITDNIPGTGDERIVRTTYNPFVQLAFVRNQALVSTLLPALDAALSLHLAEKAWKYARERGHDRRTIFIAQELDAALELRNAGSPLVSQELIGQLLRELLGRQDRGTSGLSHYFLEREGDDAYRSVAFSCLPATALLRARELGYPGDPTLAREVEAALRGYIDRFLLADAGSNPYGLTPYGAFIQMPHASEQRFRDAGRGRGVRTFIHPFNAQFMVHGTNGVVMNQAFLLAKAGHLLNEKTWTQHAERLLQWSTGHNPTGLSLFYGIGLRSVVPYSGVNLNLPQAATNGFIGRPDDTPYMETSNLIGWNTQEIWDIPYIYAAGAAAFLGLK
jgi:hypothetical protein